MKHNASESKATVLNILYFQFLFLNAATSALPCQGNKFDSEGKYNRGPKKK